jgi:hypothetical protein
MPSLAAIGSSASFLHPLRREAGRPPTRNRRPRHVCSWGPNYGGCIKIGCLAEPVEQLVAEWVIRPLSGPALSAATGRIGPSGSCSTAVGRPGPAGDERPHAPESGGGEPGHGHGLSDAKSETSDAQEDALTATGTGNDALRERHHRHQRAGDAELPASDSVELSHNSRLVMDETTRMVNRRLWQMRRAISACGSSSCWPGSCTPCWPR